MREVSEFIVVAPAGQGKALRFVEERLLGHLATRFPHYSFRLEPWGPFADDEEFSVLPIMNRAPEPGEATGDPDQFYMCAPLDPRVIPQIRESLREFEMGAVH